MFSTVAQQNGTLGSFEHVVLMSGSPRRRALLAFLHPRREHVPCDEETIRQASLSETVGKPMVERAAIAARALAMAKAGCQNPSFSLLGNTLYIAADTIVVHNEQIYNKPCDMAEAERMMRSYFGTTHTVVTAVCLRTLQGMLQYETFAEVTFSPYTPQMEAQLQAYLTPQLLDRAGAYGLQDMPPGFLAEVKGDPYTVIGFSVSALWRAIAPYYVPDGATVSPTAFPSIADFQQIVQELAEELPEFLFRELNGQIQIQPQVEIHPQARHDDLVVLGRYICDTLGRRIELYYGSFQRQFPFCDREELKVHVRETLRHEFEHHVEELAGNADLAREDSLFLQNYLQQF